jgi:hypothetical protein
MTWFDMDPREFQTIAGRLAATRAYGAAGYRTAIGRAYYAVFNIAVNVLDELGLVPSGGPQVHEQTISLLKASGDSELPGIGGQINDLRTSRNHANYHLDRLDVEKFTYAQAAVETAEDIIANFDKFLADSVRRRTAILSIAPHYTRITGKTLQSLH